MTWTKVREAVAPKMDLKHQRLYIQEALDYDDNIFFWYRNFRSKILRPTIIIIMIIMIFTCDGCSRPSMMIDNKEKLLTLQS